MSEDAPGLKIRTNKNGTRTGYWIAANCSRKAKHFPDQTIRLHGPEDDWPALCRQYRDQLMAWIEEQAQPAVSRRFNGTFASLIDQYVGHELSPYFKVMTLKYGESSWPTYWSIRLAKVPLKRLLTAGCACSSIHAISWSRYWRQRAGQSSSGPCSRIVWSGKCFALRLQLAAIQYPVRVPFLLVRIFRPGASSLMSRSPHRRAGRR